MKQTGYARNTTSTWQFLNNQAAVISWKEIDEDYIEFTYDDEIDAPSHPDVDFHSDSPEMLDEVIHGRSRQRERERIAALERLN